MATRNCDPTNDSQPQAVAAAAKGYKRSFAPVTVHIESVNKSQNQVEFTAKGSSKHYTILWQESDVWVNCPSTVDAPTGGLPAPGSDGLLYLSASAFGKLEASAQQYTRVKWPEEQQGDPPNSALQLQIHDIAVIYATSQSSAQATIKVQPGGATSSLDLRNVYAPILVPKPGGGTDQITALVLQANLTATDPVTGIMNTIDLMDWRLADAFQVVTLDTATAEVRLSSTGSSLFGESAPPFDTQLTRAGTSRAASIQPVRGRASDRKRMTFLAAPAKNMGVAAVPSDGNIAIDQAQKLLDQSGTEYERVTSLREIAQSLSRLENDHRRPYEIQIIGHGSPGMLSLGFYWNPKRYTDDERGPYYLLDSNPYAYGLLDAWVHPETRVILVGCNVGSNHNSRAVSRGSSLIFDLHAMWGCDVLAADDLVGPEHFVDGRFEGSVQGYVRGRWVQAPGRRGADAAVVSTPSTFPYKDITLSVVPGLGAISSRSDEFKIDPKPLYQYTRELAFKSPLLAMNEVSFTAKDHDGTPVELHLICNGEYLKVVKHNPTTNRPDIRIFTTLDKSPGTVDRLFDLRLQPSQQIWAQIKGELVRTAASTGL